MIDFSRVARGAASAFVLQVLGAGLTYGSQIALARWMGVSSFGVYAYAMAWAMLAAILLGLGFPQSVLRFIPQYRAREDHARVRGLVRASQMATLTVSVAVALLGTAIVVVLLPRDSDTTAAAVALWLIPLGALINLDSAIIRAGGRVVGAFVPSLVVRPLALVMLGGAAWLAWGRLTAVTVIAITLGVYVAVALMQTVLVHEVLKADGAPASAMYERRVWLRVSMPLLLVAGFQLALSQADLLIIGATRGVRDAAFYLAASKTALLVSYLLVAVNAITAPLFSELETRGDRAGLQRLVSTTSQWVFWPTLAIAAGLALLSPYVLGLFGHGFQAARWALLVLLFGQLINAACGSVGYLLSMTGHQDDTARVYGITSVVNVALCYAGARTFGLTGAACSTTFSMIVWNVWLYRLTRKRIGIRASFLSYFLRRGERPMVTADEHHTSPSGVGPCQPRGAIVMQSSPLSGKAPVSDG
ncbi:MAG TPA: oligosaccharide flippase family protein [Solirubrobacteraceae bacterium]|jgi:O-antigen/teichoic acid export membrane protein